MCRTANCSLRVLKRRNMKTEELAKSAVSANAANGTLVVWAMLDFEKDTFALQTQVRKSLQLLLDEHPKDIVISVSGDAVSVNVWPSWPCMARG